MANQVTRCYDNSLRVPGSNLVEVSPPVVFCSLERYCRSKLKASFRVYHESYNVLAMCKIIIYMYREI